jgi:hypothetical protein
VPLSFLCAHPVVLYDSLSWEKSRLQQKHTHTRNQTTRGLYLNTYCNVRPVVLADHARVMRSTTTVKRRRRDRSGAARARALFLLAFFFSDVFMCIRHCILPFDAVFSLFFRLALLVLLLSFWFSLLLVAVSICRQYYICFASCTVFGTSFLVKVEI